MIRSLFRTRRFRRGFDFSFVFFSKTISVFIIDCRSMSNFRSLVISIKSNTENKIKPTKLYKHIIHKIRLDLTKRYGLNKVDDNQCYVLSENEMYYYIKIIATQ